LVKVEELGAVVVLLGVVEVYVVVEEEKVVLVKVEFKFEVKMVVKV
jgi:hypothetical protein